MAPDSAPADHTIGGASRERGGPEPPLVTVGIPAYDNAETIARAIRSVRAQTFRRWRLIVSDDASRDGTAAVCEALAAQDARIRLVRQPRNLMYMNFGFLLRQAETPFFAWLAGDDMWHPAFLESCLAALEARPDAVSAVPRCLFVRGTGVVSQAPDTATIDGDWPARARAFLERPNGTRMYGLFRTDVLKRAFPARNMYAYDLAMTLAALREGPQIGVDRTLITRTRTPWQEYSRSVRRLYASRILRALPLLDMTAYALRRRLVPLRVPVLARLAALNAIKHEDYVFVNLPGIYARLRPVYRLLALPIAQPPDAPLAAARALLAQDAGARALGVRLLEGWGAAGRVEADLELGRYWMDAGVVPQGYREAARCFARAARNGSSEAGLELVRTEAEAGRLAPEAAARLYLRAAARGSRAAAVELARLVCAGRTGAIDLAGASRALEAARGTGHPTVLRAIASLAERGAGRPRDRGLALALHVLAAGQDARAAREVGRMLVEDAEAGALAEAEHWFRRAAEEGDPWALRDLAEHLAGAGRPGEARALCLRAAAASTSPELAREIDALMATLSRSGDGRPPSRRVPASPGGEAGTRPPRPPARAWAARRARPTEEGGLRNLVVWGVHRSGTSLLAEALERMGWRLGPANRAATVENPRGFFENRVLVDVNRRLLAAAGVSWSNWGVDFSTLSFEDPRYEPFRRTARALLDALDEEAGMAAWAIKDPRLTALAGFWAPLLGERELPPRHVLVLRDPREVAASQVARALQDPAAYRLLHRAEAMLVLWASSMVSVLRALADQDILVVAHSDLAADAGGALSRVAAFAGAPAAAAAAAADVFQASFHRSEPGQAAVGGPWDALTGEPFRRLGGAGAPLTPDDIARILRDSAEIERALGYLRPAAGLLDAFERGEGEWFGHSDA
jgi:glycosyltransferase involved in cell wall biosynthesis